MANTYGSKIAFGDTSKIQEAIDNGIIDERDIVLSRDIGDRLTMRVVGDDKSIRDIRTSIDVFESLDVAQVWCESNKSSLLNGQPIAIFSTDTKQYELHTVYVNGETIAISSQKSQAIKQISRSDKTTILSELNSGLYAISSPYKMSDEDEVINPVSEVLFIVSKENNTISYFDGGILKSYKEKEDGSYEKVEYVTKDDMNEVEVALPTATTADIDSLFD